jgi:hypothetical protein
MEPPALLQEKVFGGCGQFLREEYLLNLRRAIPQIFRPESV